MAESELYDLIIVGGGPAGLTAGMYAMRAALKTVLLEKGLMGGQVALTKDVKNYPGYVFTDDKCETKNTRYFRRA